MTEATVTDWAPAEPLLPIPTQPPSLSRSLAGEIQELEANVDAVTAALLHLHLTLTRPVAANEDDLDGIDDDDSESDGETAPPRRAAPKDTSPVEAVAGDVSALFGPAALVAQAIVNLNSGNVIEGVRLAGIAVREHSSERGAELLNKVHARAAQMGANGKAVAAACTAALVHVAPPPEAAPPSSPVPHCFAGAGTAVSVPCAKLDRAVVDVCKVAAPIVEAVVADIAREQGQTVQISSLPSPPSYFWGPPRSCQTHNRHADTLRFSAVSLAYHPQQLAFSYFGPAEAERLREYRRRILPVSLVQNHFAPLCAWKTRC